MNKLWNIKIIIGLIIFMIFISIAKASMCAPLRYHLELSYTLGDDNTIIPDYDTISQICNIPVPNRYSASKIEGETSIYSGFVIYEGDINWDEILNPESNEIDEETGLSQRDINIFNLQKTTNQYVWIPVDDIDDMYRIDSRRKIFGKPLQIKSDGVYAFHWNTSGSYMNFDYGIKEFDMTESYTSGDIDSEIVGHSGLNTRYSLLTRTMEQDQQRILKSIKKYGGFYIGRYETGSLSTNPVVRKMGTDLGSVSWYNIYQNSKKLKGINNDVETSMCWGSYWDHMAYILLNLRIKNSQGTVLTRNHFYTNSYALTWGNFKNSEFTYIGEDQELPIENETKPSGEAICIPTGSSEYTKAYNLYDIGGNVDEWAMEQYQGNRSARGGKYTDNGKLSGMNSNSPGGINRSLGSRAILYIKD